MKKEILNDQTTSCHVDFLWTNTMRELWRLQQPYVPINLADITPHFETQREGWVNELLSDCKLLGKSMEKLKKRISSESPIEVRESGFKFVNNQEFIQALLLRSHGNRADRETFIQNASDRVNVNWIAYHYAKSFLALLFLYILKNDADVAKKKWANAKLDTDYLIALAFADGLATNETSGEMSDIFYWMYGNTKKFITIRKLDEFTVKGTDTAKNAYFRWRAGGCCHGNDLVDWLSAETELHQLIWGKLS
jgi:hypothetical protein